MNEKELLRKVSDREFPSRGAELSAAEVLGASVSGKARVRGKGLRIGLAVLTAAAVGVGMAVSKETEAAESQAESISAPKVSEAASSEQTEVCISKPLYLHILDDMREHPDNFLTSAETIQRDADFVWTKNGEETKGLCKVTTQTGYTVLDSPDDEKDYNVDPSAAIEFIKLIDSKFNSWQESPAAAEYCGSSVLFESLISDMPWRVLVRTEKHTGSDQLGREEKGVDVTVYFERLDDQPLVGPSCISFFTDSAEAKLTEENGSDRWEIAGITYIDGVPQLNSIGPTFTADKIYAGKIDSFGTLTLKCGGRGNYQNTEITLTSDLENGKLIIDTDITAPTENSKITGIVSVPSFMTYSDNGATLTSLLVDGKKPGLGRSSKNAGDTLAAGEHVSHHYELTYIGDPYDVAGLEFVSLYETVLPYWDDGLPERSGSETVILFTDAPER